MRKDQIEKLLDGVIRNYCEKLKSINVLDFDFDTCNKVIEILSTRTYIAGGCIPSMILNEYVNDFDIYFYNKEDVDTVVSFYNKYLGLPELCVTLITTNAINTNCKIQLITKYYGSPEVITENFDWEHIKSWYDVKEKQVHFCPDIHRILIEKQLVYTGSEYPLSSLLRLRKLISRGWRVSTKTILAIVFDVIDKLQYQTFTPDEVKNNFQIFTNNEVEFVQRMSEQDEEIIEHPKYYSIDALLDQLNGVDPLIIQAELEKHFGKYLTVREILSII